MYRHVGTMTLALAWFPVLAADARAELLFESNGVELHGTARLLLSGASTCNVLESDTSYESKQANHGAPMDVWRLDFQVLNRTGRWLDHLIAGYQIASEWPACTNWDRPEGLDVFVKVDWAGAIGTIQEDRPERGRPGREAHGNETLRRAARRPAAAVLALVADFRNRLGRSGGRRTGSAGGRGGSAPRSGDASSAPARPAGGRFRPRGCGWSFRPADTGGDTRLAGKSGSSAHGLSDRRAGRGASGSSCVAAAGVCWRSATASCQRGSRGHLLAVDRQRHEPGGVRGVSGTIPEWGFPSTG